MNVIRNKKEKLQASLLPVVLNFLFRWLKRLFCQHNTRQRNWHSQLEWSCFS